MDENAEGAFAEAARWHQAGKLEPALARYRQLWAAYPGDDRLAFALGSVLIQAGQAEEGVAILSALVRAGGGIAALNNLASGLAALGRHAELLACYTRLCAAQPDAAMHPFRRGYLLAEMHRDEEALADFDRALGLAPRHVKALLGRANALFRLGRTTEAIAACRQAAEIRPDAAGPRRCLGDMLTGSGHFGEALTVYSGLIARDPADAEAYLQRSRVQSKRGRHREALADCDAALALHADFADAHLQRGFVLRALRRTDEAASAFRQAAELAPQCAGAHFHLASALFALKRYADALDSYRRVIAIGEDPAGEDSAKAHNGCGCALQKLGRTDEAVACFDRAIALCPDLAEAYFNRANAFAARDIDRARADFRRAVHCKPDYVDARVNLARLDLLSGDYAAGWQGYECRWLRGPLKESLPPCPGKAWRGEMPVAGKTVLLFSEQGYGDSIQFCRYVPMVADLGARVVLAVPAEILPLMRSLRGGGTIVCCDRKKPLPSFDVHCPLMSLPLAFGTELGTIPADTPYLSADPARRAAWRRRLGAKTAPRIGLAWSGRAGSDVDFRRSIPFAALAPVLALPFEFHCLQKVVRDADRADVAACARLTCHEAALGDFADTAALLAEMDLVVSVDTCIAHLAGALNVPLFLMPRPGEWRWLRTREDTPWYPGARLFRQGASGRWDGAIMRVAAALSDRFGI